MTVVIKDGGKRQLDFDVVRINAYVDRVINGDFENLDIDGFKSLLVEEIESRSEISASELTNLTVQTAKDKIGLNDGSVKHPDWAYVAARFYLQKLYKEAAKNRNYDSESKYGGFYALQKALASEGTYSADILREYTKEEIILAESWIDAEKDKLFKLIGLETLERSYLAKDKNKNLYELPQERFMVIAMTEMINEHPAKRMELVKEAYWALSNLYMTVATPTLSNAGKSYGQLSSCFILTVDDSLQSIYDVNTDVANLSKGGGGIGVYVGFIRSKGSDIKGIKGISSGTVPWLKQLNNTAVSVDQLGTRQGSIVATQDVFHKDIFAHLAGKLNTGDERQRFHDLFLGVSIPDLFMEKVKNRGDWALFDPHEVKAVKGWYLQDFYDETKGAGSFRQKYEELLADERVSKTIVPAVDVYKGILKAQMETGSLYMFFRDEVNRQNPNKHEGMIYSSNLCQEVANNMSATITEEIKLDGGKIVVTKDPGDTVVCNLSSINLGTAVEANVLERLIPIQIRMLDNIITLNETRLPVKETVHTNQKYRSVGLGTFGWHHLLTQQNVKWESQESVDYADALYEKIAYLAIQASMELSKEKGSYLVFEGSEWHTGKYFERRGYASHDDLDWDQLKSDVAEHGLRNGWLMAVAPNSSTAHIGGSTPSIDPINSLTMIVEKKGIKTVVPAPGITDENRWFYKTAFNIDQKWSILQNAARQRHIDQSQSFNLYLKQGVKASELLDLHMLAWEKGVKTIYYTRTMKNQLDEKECESCHS